MASRRELVVVEEKKKRNSALVVGGATLVGAALLWQLFWMLGVFVLLGGGVATFGKARDWFKFRAENGIYF